MTRMTGGQALVKSIIANGVDTLFGLPGVQLDHFFNALYDEGNAIRVINCRHEQGAAYMALGYALATGEVGAYAVVPGPGVLNTMAALATAYGANARILCLTGQIPSAYIGRGLGMLHEIPDQLAMLEGLTKWAARIEHPADAPDAVAEAFRQLKGGHPRPVGLEMALDLMAQDTEVRLNAPVTIPTPHPVDPELIAEAARLLGQAEAPLIIVGGGVFGAETELEELAEMLQAPVVANRTGRGALSDRHYLSLTQPAGHRLWAKADVVLAVGTRLQHQRMNWGTDDRLKIIHVNVDGNELKKIASPAVALATDARETLAALIPAVAKKNRSRPSRKTELTALKAETMTFLEEQLGPQMAWLKALRQGLPDDGILVDELTQIGYMARAAFPVYESRNFICNGYQGTLGYGLATAIGVKVARPDRPVLSINGDGGFMFNVQELSSAVKHGIPIVAVIFNDQAYGNVKRMQQDLHGGRVIASDLVNPDFVKLAESMGAAGIRAETPDALKQAVTDAVKLNQPAVIDVPVGPMPDPWGILIQGRVRGTS